MGASCLMKDTSAPGGNYKRGYRRENGSPMRNKEKLIFEGWQIMPYIIIFYFNRKEMAKLILPENRSFNSKYSYEVCQAI